MQTELCILSLISVYSGCIAGVSTLLIRQGDETTYRIFLSATKTFFGIALIVEASAWLIVPNEPRVLNQEITQDIISDGSTKTILVQCYRKTITSSPGLIGRLFLPSFVEEVPQPIENCNPKGDTNE